MACHWSRVTHNFFKCFYETILALRANMPFMPVRPFCAEVGTRRNKLKTDASRSPQKAKDSFGLRGLVGRIKSLGRSTALIFQCQKFRNIYLSLRRVTHENALTESENGRPRLVVEAHGRVISNSLSLQASCMSLDSHQLHSRRGFVFQVRTKARISSE